MTEPKPSVGRIVHYYPGTSPENALPNSMVFAPAIVSQTFGGDMVNLTIFVADPAGNPVRQGWSVHHKEHSLGEGAPYWEWPPRS